MSTLTSQLSYSLMGAALMLLLMGLGVAIFVPVVDRWSKRFFITFFAILVLYGTLALTESLIENDPGMMHALLILYYFDTILISVLFPLLMAYMLHCCGESLLQSRPFRLEIALMIGVFIMINMTLFFPCFYYLSPDGQFTHGPLYPLLAGQLFMMILLPLICTLRRRNRLSRRYFHAFLIGLIPIAAGALPVFFTPSFLLFSFGIAICAISMYVIILSDQIEQNVRQQQEIAQHRANVMVLQMRPHFIYNTLMSIYSLCNQDPQKARQVTMDFTNYLRKNFNAVASGSPIPFSAELEHTRAYLAVEQAQYEEMLLVEYDTPFTRFRLPPLTLQPLVENAVKHGMNPYAGPLHVCIRTRHTSAGSVLTVEDSGSGFDLSDDSEPHIALSNIRQRLAMMCGGSMTIKPRESGGTVVTIRIPPLESPSD